MNLSFHKLVLLPGGFPRFLCNGTKPLDNHSCFPFTLLQLETFLPDYFPCQMAPFISFCSTCHCLLLQTWIRAINHDIAWIQPCLEMPSAEQISSFLLDLATLQFSGQWLSAILCQNTTAMLSSLVLDRVLAHLCSPMSQVSTVHICCCSSERPPEGPLSIACSIVGRL